MGRPRWPIWVLLGWAGVPAHAQVPAPPPGAAPVPTVPRQVPSAATATAEALPCSIGPDSATSLTLRWRQPPPEAGQQPVTQWMLSRQAAGRPLEVFALAPVGPDASGLMSASVPGFASTDAWTVAIYAVSPGGWSDRSNTLAIPPSARRCGLPAAPAIQDVIVTPAPAALTEGPTG
jgi:hypothetical protein